MSDDEYDDDFEAESPSAAQPARRPSPRKTRGTRRPTGAAGRGSRPSARDRLRAMNAEADKADGGRGGAGSSSTSARDRLRAMNAEADREARDERERSKGIDALVSAAGGGSSAAAEGQTKNKRATDGGSRDGASSVDEAALEGVDTGAGLSTMITSARCAPAAAT